MESVAAVEVLIVVTIMPVIAQDLGGLRLYGLALAASGLAVVITIPLAGQAMDRWGAVKPLAAMLGVFTAGTLLAALAPSMPILIAGRFLQGCGAGAQYAISLGTVARSYPDRLRPRVIALLSAAWLLPGLVGPAIGAGITAAVGWRWALTVPLAVLAAAAVLVFPALSARPRAGQPPAPSIRWPLLLALGSGLLVAGLTAPWQVALPFAVAGGWVAVVSGRGLVRALGPPEHEVDAGGRAAR